MFSINSIRLRLAILISVILIPVAIFIIFQNYSTYVEARERALEDLQLSARSLSFEQSQAIEGARQLLIALSDSSEINGLDPLVCSRYLSKLLTSYSRYANFGVADLKGRLICSAVDSNRDVNISERQFFKGTLSTKNFSVGEFQVGAITKKAVLNFGYPILNVKNEVIAIVFSSLDLSWVNQFVSGTATDPDTVLLILDSKGVVLARSPDPEKWIGESFMTDPLIETVLNKGGGVTDVTGLDSVRRLYVFQKLEGTDPLNPVYIVIGKTQESIYSQANSNLARSITVLIMMAVFLGFVSWSAGRFIIVKRLEDLEELNKLKSDFVSIASHQLRTPLSAINWFIELFNESESGKLSVTQKGILKKISLSNRRMINLVESLLSVSRTEAKKLPIHNEVIFVQDVLEKVIRENIPLARRKKLKLVTQNTKKNYKIFADTKLYFQVLNNVLNNAVKYTPKDGKVTINMYSEKGQVLVKISDTGYGIPAKDQEKVFQRFFRADNISEYDIEGTGLGLYIARSTAREMGGEITFKSKVGTGSAFYVSFPRHL